MCDGDKLLVIKDKLLTKIAKRNMQDIVPLAYNLGKAEAEQLTPESFYNGMVANYTGGNIGVVSNEISKVWNSENITEEQLNVVKWLTMKNNQVIDFAKTRWKTEPPEEIDKIIKSYTKSKLPNFFIYAKDKTPKQVESPNNSTMNRIAAKIPDPKLKFNKSISKFDYRMLMNLDEDFSISSDNPVIKSYDYWNARTNEFVEDKAIKNQDMYKYHKLREKVAEESVKDIEYVVNTLVAYLYTIRKTSAKKGLWDAFGDVIVKNLKKNLEGKGRICPVCGKRFEPKVHNQVCCSELCSKERDIRNKRESRKGEAKSSLNTM